MLAAALEQELTEFLGRKRYERGEGKRAGYRNGYQRPREVAVGLGHVSVRVPRVRETGEPFESQIVKRYERTSSSVKQLIPSLYLARAGNRGLRTRVTRFVGRFGATVTQLHRTAQSAVGKRVPRLERASASRPLSLRVGRWCLS